MKGVWCVWCGVVECECDERCGVVWWSVNVVKGVMCCGVVECKCYEGCGVVWCGMVWCG